MKSVNLLAFNSYKINSSAYLISRPKTYDQLVTCLRENASERFVIGHGNNIILSRDAYPSTTQFICLASYRQGFKMLSDNSLFFPAGYSLREACLAARNLGLSGIENLWDIPSSIGGAVYMNAGAYGVDFLSSVDYVDVLSLECFSVQRLPKSQLGAGYRSSRFSRAKGEVILGAAVSLEYSSPSAVSQAMRLVAVRRRSRFPYSEPNAGSLFKRPQNGLAASNMLDLSGCKGMTVGAAEINNMHAGFCVARTGVTGSDIIDLSERCRSTVQTKFDVSLDLEQVVI
jgi:UDP-N-acetylmuramate dehydrogenase